MARKQRNTKSTKNDMPAKPVATKLEKDSAGSRRTSILKKQSSPKPRKPQHETSGPIVEFMEQWTAARDPQFVTALQKAASGHPVVLAVPRHGPFRSWVLPRLGANPLIVDGFVLSQKVPTLAEETPFVKLCCAAGLFVGSAASKRVATKYAQMERSE